LPSLLPKLISAPLMRSCLHLGISSLSTYIVNAVRPLLSS
jgi:hypothetical protein